MIPILTRNFIHSFDSFSPLNGSMLDGLRSNPKSVFFVCPDPGKSKVHSLNRYWYDLSDKSLPFPSQLGAAKILVEGADYERLCRAVAFFTRNWNCSLWWIIKNWDKVEDEFGW